MEYLKNVFLNFLVAENDGKIHMLKAIAAVLKFDDEELQLAVDKLKHHHAAKSRLKN